MALALRISALNHSSRNICNQSSGHRLQTSTVVDYSDRLQAAMTAAKVDKTALANELGISYQAVRKALEGGKFSAANNAKAAKFLNVSSDWLATGIGPQPALAAASPQSSEREATEQRSPREPGEIRPPDAQEQLLLANLRLLREQDRQHFYDQVARAAQEARQAAEEWSERFGVDLPPEFRATADDHATFAALPRQDAEPEKEPAPDRRQRSA